MGEGPSNEKGPFAQMSARYRVQLTSNDVVVFMSEGMYFSDEKLPSFVRFLVTH